MRDVLKDWGGDFDGHPPGFKGDMSFLARCLNRRVRGDDWRVRL